MIDVVIFDIDGTLANCSHRLHHVTGHGAKDWTAFFDKMGDDLPIEPIVRLFIELETNGNMIVICTGRPEKYRALTETWLREAGVEFYHSLHMRPDGDKRPTNVIKQQMLSALRKDGLDPWLVVEDRPSVCDMWRDEGLVVLQVHGPGAHMETEEAA